MRPSTSNKDEKRAAAPYQMQAAAESTSMPLKAKKKVISDIELMSRPEKIRKGLLV